MERREYERRGFWLPVAVAGLEEGIAVSHNASDSGLLVVCRSPPKVGARLRLTFRIPPESPTEVSVFARVLRVGKNVEDPDGLWPHEAALVLEEPVPALHAYLASLPPSND